MSTAVVYGDINPGIIDGSSVWLVSITEVLSGIFDDVYLQLKTKPVNRRLLSRIESIPNIHVREYAVVDVADESAYRELSPPEAAKVLRDLVREVNPDVVVVRGLAACFESARVAEVSRVLWAYVTDLPYPVTKTSKVNLGRLRTIAQRARRMFAQTESTRSYLEQIIGQAAGKTLLMPPMIPPEAYARRSEAPRLDGATPLEAVYAGKLAKDWCVEEMLDLPAALRARNVDCRLTVLGDKFQREKSDPDFVQRLREKLESLTNDPQSGVRWVGGVPRDEVFRYFEVADVGVGWRTAALNSSTEISTKLLEYSAAGLIPIVNRTADNCGYLGTDYPFFVDADVDIEEIAQNIEDNLDKFESARRAAAQLAQRFSMEAAETRLRREFTRAGVLVPAGRVEVTGGEPEPVKLLVASHDFKFMGELMESLRGDRRFELKVDAWTSLRDHDEARSEELAQWADVIFCEWAGPSVGWFAKHKRKHTRLVTRLHGFELRGPWIREVAGDAVDHIVFVSEFYQAKAVTTLGLDPGRTSVITNVIDWIDFDRPKLAGAEFRLGMIGMVPFGKRPDRALDVLEKLLEHDDRFSLHIKGQNPWNYPYHWKDPYQKQAYLEFYRRIADSEVLSSRVAFDPFSPAVASWFRKIGFILSPSHNETFHLAVAEGMASRAVPMIWEREGAVEIFSDAHVRGGTDQVIEAILAIQRSGSVKDLGERAREYAARWDQMKVYDQWANVLTP
ncbi:glycosyltransferase family 4 protein [Corynebacterium meridianum]|uniref:Glycosyltransferase family 4 protein n=1 Tax=Corynebacterium meridianum TaxID=2765363 RepID=A0A934M5H6_9CORY|nr:glycosyltransferase family 4 protein [Corynebacterium meridianum]MBI8990141.1 glycosyltransferase family 4 protein [Corynebacterium meridianum]